MKYVTVNYFYLDLTDWKLALPPLAQKIHVGLARAIKARQEGRIVRVVG